jgi:peptidoglycan/xylan/chitin deacetylase (PgdA/CDA1 family)
VQAFSNAGERLQYAGKLKPFLKTVSHEARSLVLDRVIATFSDVEVPKLMMDWNDLRQLKGAGHYIGSHTVSHSMLGTMTDEVAIKRELLHSAKTIERELGHFPLSISYPVGSFNETTKRLSAACGYKIGLAVKQRIFNPVKDDLFEIPRMELYNEPWWKTRMRIGNTLEQLKAIIKYK